MRGLGHRCSSQAHQGNGGQNWGTPGTARGNGNRGRGRGGTANMENPRQNHADRGLPLTPRRAREVRPRPLLSLSVALVALARGRDPPAHWGEYPTIESLCGSPCGGKQRPICCSPCGGTHSSCFKHPCNKSCNGLAYELLQHILAMGSPLQWRSGPLPARALWHPGSFPRIALAHSGHGPTTKVGCRTLTHRGAAALRVCPRLASA